jgi:signal recognition particle subunit SRP54
MGGLGGVMGMLPGVAKMQGADDERQCRRKPAAQAGGDHLLDDEDANGATPKLLDGKRKRRIAAGSGTSVEEVNRLVKQFMEMSRVMKQMGRLGQKGMMRTGIGNLFRR